MRGSGEAAACHSSSTSHRTRSGSSANPCPDTAGRELGWRLDHPGRADSRGDLPGRQVSGHTGSAGSLVWMDPETQGFCVLFSDYLRSRAPWRPVHLSDAVAAAFT